MATNNNQMISGSNSFSEGVTINNFSDLSNLSAGINIINVTSEIKTSTGNLPNSSYLCIKGLANNALISSGLILLDLILSRGFMVWINKSNMLIIQQFVVK